MREVLFKAKRIGDGEWVQGYLFRIWEKAYILWGATNDIPDMIEVSPETVCQYTGSTDKNGNKIWENDIVRKTDANALGWTRIRNCKVNYANLGFWTIETEFGDRYWLGGFGEAQLEVIGNIFDNPELMEVE